MASGAPIPVRLQMARLAVFNDRQVDPEGRVVALLDSYLADGNTTAFRGAIRWGAEDGRWLLHCHAGCSFMDVIAAADLSLTDVGADTAPASVAVAEEYDYRDESGKLLYQVVRTVPKSFRQWRPDGSDVEVVAHDQRLGESQSRISQRTKTQASFSTEGAALTVLFGLVAVGQIVFRKIDGHQDLAAFLMQEQWCQAA